MHTKNLQPAGNTTCVCVTTENKYKNISLIRFSLEHPLKNMPHSVSLNVQFCLTMHCGYFLFHIRSWSVYQVIKGKNMMTWKYSNFLALRSLVICNPVLLNWALIQYKMAPYQYRKSHCGDIMVVRLSYLHNGISSTGKTMFYIESGSWFLAFRHSIFQHHEKTSYLLNIMSVVDRYCYS